MDSLGTALFRGRLENLQSGDWFREGSRKLALLGRALCGKEESFFEGRELGS